MAVPLKPAMLPDPFALIEDEMKAKAVATAVRHQQPMLSAMQALASENQALKKEVELLRQEVKRLKGGAAVVTGPADDGLDAMAATLFKKLVDDRMIAPLNPLLEMPASPPVAPPMEAKKLVKRTTDDWFILDDVVMTGIEVVEQGAKAVEQEATPAKKRFEWEGEWDEDAQPAELSGAGV